jgi:hypothetical protein
MKKGWMKGAGIGGDRGRGRGRQRDDFRGDL